MAHGQKPNFVFRRNGRVHLNRQGRHFSRLLAAEVYGSAVVMLDTSSPELVKGTGYPLHSTVFPSLPFPCITVCHHISTGVYNIFPCYLTKSTIWGKGRGVIEHKMCVLVFSRTCASDISLSKNNSRRYYHKCT